MPSFARALETTLHNALTAAKDRAHEYATLEHLLLALIDDEHASKVMSSCGVDLSSSCRNRRSGSRNAWRFPRAILARRRFRARMACRCRRAAPVARRYRA